MCLLKFWFQTDLGRENSASYYRQGKQLLFMLTRWSRSTSNLYSLIGQNLTGKFMRKTYAASWNYRRPQLCGSYKKNSIFFYKNRNTNDSPCVFVSVFVFCFCFFFFPVFLLLGPLASLFIDLRFWVVLTRSKGRLGSLKPIVPARSSINPIEMVQTRQNCRQRICW